MVCCLTMSCKVRSKQQVIWRHRICVAKVHPAGCFLEIHDLSNEDNWLNRASPSTYIYRNV